MSRGKKNTINFVVISDKIASIYSEVCENLPASLQNKNMVFIAVKLFSAWWNICISYVDVLEILFFPILLSRRIEYFSFNFL